LFFIHLSLGLFSEYLQSLDVSQVTEQEETLDFPSGSLMMADISQPSFQDRGDLTAVGAPVDFGMSWREPNPELSQTQEDIADQSASSRAGERGGARPKRKQLFPAQRLDLSTSDRGNSSYFSLGIQCSSLGRGVWVCPIGLILCRLLGIISIITVPSTISCFTVEVRVAVPPAVIEGKRKLAVVLVPVEEELAASIRDRT
jgi:hypothetical protein